MSRVEETTLDNPNMLKTKSSLYSWQNDGRLVVSCLCTQTCNCKLTLWNASSLQPESLAVGLSTTASRDLRVMSCFSAFAHYPKLLNSEWILSFGNIWVSISIDPYHIPWRRTQSAKQNGHRDRLSRSIYESSRRKLPDALGTPWLTFGWERIERKSLKIPDVYQYHSISLYRYMLWRNRQPVEPVVGAECVALVAPDDNVYQWHRTCNSTQLHLHWRLEHHNDLL